MYIVCGFDMFLCKKHMAICFLLMTCRYLPCQFYTHTGTRFLILDMMLGEVSVHDICCSPYFFQSENMSYLCI